MAPAPPDTASPTIGGQLVSAAPTGPDGRKVIQTLPPLDLIEDHIPISEATGQPRRDPVMVVGMSLLYAGALLSALGWCIGWWHAITLVHWHTSTQLVMWWYPRPGSKESMWAAVFMAVIAAITVAAPGLAGFQAWNGYRWSRTLALVASGLSLLGILMVPWVSWSAIPLVFAGTGVLFLAPVSRYFEHWTRFRTPPEPRPMVFGAVHYGPLQRYL